MIPNGDKAISLRNLTKNYGQSRGITDVSFDVHAGEVFGFLGPNGAGKSTTMRTLVGLINSTSGEAQILGKNALVGDVSILDEVGYLPGSLSLYKNLTGSELLHFLAKIRKRDCSARISSLSSQLKLDLNTHIRNLSKGNRQKVGVVQAFMHNPKVLILDEPTSGLDPLIQREFEAILAESKGAGAAILFSSHVLSEVEHLADRIAIIDEGQILLNEDIHELKKRAVHTLDLLFETPVDISAFQRLPSVENAQISGNIVTCSVKGSETEILRLAVSIGVSTVRSHEASLDEIFLSLIDKAGS